MGAYTAVASGNWSSNTTWGTSAGDYPGAANSGDTVTIGDGSIRNVTLDVDLTAHPLASITNGDSTSYITVSTTRAITLTGDSCITYSGTNTSGFIRVGTGGNLTLTGPGGTSKLITNTGLGWCISVSSTGVLSLQNAAGTAILVNTTTGRGVSHSGAGAGSLTIVGHIASNYNAAYGVYISGALTGTIGNGTYPCTISSNALNGYGIYVNAGATLSITGTVTDNNSGAAIGDYILYLGSSATGATVTLQAGTGQNAVNYGGTRTTGCVVVSAGTLNITGVAAQAAVHNTGAGYAVVTSSTGILSVNNTTNTAILNETGSGGRGIQAGGNGAVTITGDITNTQAGSSIGFYHNSSSTGSTIAGNLSSSVNIGVSIAAGTITWTPRASGTSAAITSSGTRAISVGSSGTLTIAVTNGCPTTTEVAAGATTGATPIYSTGTINFTGSCALATTTECHITILGGNLYLATASDQLTLANSGTFIVQMQGGTLTTTSGSHVASITNQGTPESDLGFAAILGGTAANRECIHGPVVAPGSTQVNIFGPALVPVPY